MISHWEVNKMDPGTIENLSEDRKDKTKGSSKIKFFSSKKTKLFSFFQEYFKTIGDWLITHHKVCGHQSNQTFQSFDRAMPGWCRNSGRTRVKGVCQSRRGWKLEERAWSGLKWKTWKSGQSRCRRGLGPSPIQPGIAKLPQRSKRRIDMEMAEAQ